MRKLFLTLAVAAVTVTSMRGQDAPAPPVKAQTVPFKLLPSRHMLVELMINGKGPFRVIFDTGAPLNLVNAKLAKAAGVKNKGGFSLFSGPPTATLDKVKLGGVEVDKLPVMVMDHPTVKSISDAFEGDYGTIDGIVGFPLFARFATTVDYQKRELVMTPTGYKPGDYMKDLQNALTSAADKPGPKVVGAAGLWGFAVEKADDTDPGVVVKTVAADGPAAKAGLKPGDRVVTIDGRWSDTVGDAYIATSLVKPGRSAELSVVRGTDKLTLKCTPVKGY